MRIFAALILCASTVFAATKPEPVYQDAVLKDFKRVQTGQSCSTYGSSNGNVNAHTNDSGNTNGTITTNSSASTTCSPTIMTLYTVVVGDHEYVVTPTDKLFSGEHLARSFLHKSSDLAGILPGTPIKVRTEGKDFYVKVGKRESTFKMVSAK